MVVIVEHLLTMSASPSTAWLTLSSSRPEGWTILPKRWVVERTLSWFNGSRRLSKDYEISNDSSETQVKLSHIHLLLRRLFHL